MYIINLLYFNGGINGQIFEGGMDNTERIDYDWVVLGIDRSTVRMEC
jgi:hypothetical protein